MGRSVSPLRSDTDRPVRSCSGGSSLHRQICRRVTRVLEWIIGQRGTPEVIRCDNGPEFTSRHFLVWCEERGIRLIHIQPGRPMQNGHVKSFNSRFRDECLNHHWFTTLADAKEKIERWLMEYNSERPHSSRAYRTPEEYARSAQSSPTGWRCLPSRLVAARQRKRSRRTALASSRTPRRVARP